MRNDRKVSNDSTELKHRGDILLPDLWELRLVEIAEPELRTECILREHVACKAVKPSMKLEGLPRFACRRKVFTQGLCVLSDQRLRRGDSILFEELRDDLSAGAMKLVAIRREDGLWERDKAEPGVFVAVLSGACVYSAVVVGVLDMYFPRGDSYYRPIPFMKLIDVPGEGPALDDLKVGLVQTCRGC